VHNAVTDCSMQVRSVTPNLMIPRHSTRPARRASDVSSRPITPATGRQSQMIGILSHALANESLIFYATYHLTYPLGAEVDI